MISKNKKQEATKLRERYNVAFSIREKNAEKIEITKRKLETEYSPKLRFILDEQKSYDIELRAELIDLDNQINKLLKIIK